MNSTHVPGPVLVTGGTGFLAGHTILQLLDVGRAVRATVRSAARSDDLQQQLSKAGAALTRLDIVVTDLMLPLGWDDAMRGVKAVLHMATPMQGANVEAAALDGTRLVLEAAARAGVRRVVFTSTGLASSQPAMRPMSGVITENDWTDTTRVDLGVYARSKTEAERLAWQLATDHDLDVTTILPGAIFGPPVNTESATWSALIGAMLAGKLKFLPPISLHWVDVRDLAALHIAALDSPVAIGQRYLAHGDRLAVRDLAQMLRDDLGARASKISTRELPAWVMRFLALFSAQVRSAVPLLNDRASLSSEKAFRDLGWRTRPIRDSLRDIANAELGLS
jgi:dihydroflavonol-4-reductase